MFELLLADGRNKCTRVSSTRFRDRGRIVPVYECRFAAKCETLRAKVGEDIFSGCVRFIERKFVFVINVLMIISRVK